MLLRVTIAAALVLGNCAEREYGDDAPNLSFKGPLAPLALSPAQIKLVKKGISESLKDPTSASFGRSYRAGMSAQVLLHPRANRRSFYQSGLPRVKRSSQPSESIAGLGASTFRSENR
jgi:hypothetical protein